MWFHGSSDFVGRFNPRFVGQDGAGFLFFSASAMVASRYGECITAVDFDARRLPTVTIDQWLESADIEHLRRNFSAFVIPGDGSFDWPVDVLVMCGPQAIDLKVQSRMSRKEAISSLDDGLPFKEPEGPMDRGWDEFLELVGMTEAAMLADIKGLSSSNSERINHAW